MQEENGTVCRIYPRQRPCPGNRYSISSKHNDRRRPCPTILCPDFHL